MSEANVLPLEGGRGGARDTQRSLTKSFGRALKLGGTLTEVAWLPPADMTENQWLQAGVAFAAMDTGISWWVGDWWAFGEARYGSRKAAVEADGWLGPAFQTCRNAAVICRAFETSRRRDVLTFSHHETVAALPPAEADKLLNWCQETIEETDKPRSTRELRNRVREANRAAHVEDLRYPEGRYGLIYCDPPWRYEFSLTDARKIENQYPTMSQDELLAFPMGDKFAADDAMLFMWAVNPRLPEALALMAAWGFEYVTNTVWVKDKIGMGYHARAQHEMLLIGRRGKVPPPAPENRFSSVIFGERGQHSKKPDETYVRIEEGYPTLPKIEVFARNDRPGWVSWGNQLPEAAE